MENTLDGGLLLLYDLAIGLVDTTYTIIKLSCQCIVMDPLYPPGLDENRAVDDVYPASWIYSFPS